MRLCLELQSEAAVNHIRQHTHTHKNPLVIRQMVRDNVCVCVFVSVCSQTPIIVCNAYVHATNMHVCDCIQ